jgi:hypothetical protein
MFRFAVLVLVCMALLNGCRRNEFRDPTFNGKAVGRSTCAFYLPDDLSLPGNLRPPSLLAPRNFADGIALGRLDLDGVRKSAFRFRSSLVSYLQGKEIEESNLAKDKRLHLVNLLAVADSAAVRSTLSYSSEAKPTASVDFLAPDSVAALLSRHQIDYLLLVYGMTMRQTEVPGGISPQGMITPAATAVQFGARAAIWDRRLRRVVWSRALEDDSYGGSAKGVALDLYWLLR